MIITEAIMTSAFSRRFLLTTKAYDKIDYLKDEKSALSSDPKGRLGISSLTVKTTSHYTHILGVWRSTVAHRVWDAGVGGSSPPAPT